MESDVDLTSARSCTGRVARAGILGSLLLLVGCFGSTSDSAPDDAGSDAADSAPGDVPAEESEVLPDGSGEDGTADAADDDAGDAAEIYEPPVCDGVRRTSGCGLHGGPSCLTHVPTAEGDAAPCELWFRQLARGESLDPGSFDGSEWIETQVVAMSTSGEVVEVGLFLSVEEHTVPLPDFYILGANLGAGVWWISFTYRDYNLRGGTRFEYEIVELTAFADVEQPDGQVVRSWLRRPGTGYTMDDVFSRGTEPVTGACGGNVQAAVDASIVYESRTGCE